ncbi:MAG: putative inorganic carbon transporter subunit DabA, partial [Flavobacteriales bacterium]
HELLYTDHAHTFLGGTLSSVSLGFGAGVKLLQTLFRPRMSPAISDAFTHMHNDSELTIENTNTEDRENNLQIGYTLDEMTNRVENVLRSVGLLKNFSHLIYSIAHGSSSANNPHHSAHDCGACSGRPGSVNARVFAHMANHEGVRKNLHERGIDIPAATQFVGGLHDTAADQVDYYDERILSAENKILHAQNKLSFEKALDLNAKERTRRFASINTRASLKHTRKEILKRSVSMFEPRPELGHGTNSLCVVGRRDNTKGLHMDRRAFMNSYDYRTDPEGKILTAVMRPIGLVCGGINLEYYFSRVDNYKLGAGTKLPHNVMGLVGVANSSDGDLRPGLPVQMIEVHDPVRLLVIVEHYPEVVLNTIKTTPEMYEWYNNEWVHIVAIHPDTKEFYYHKDGAFQLYKPLPIAINKVEDQLTLAEQAKEMETNYIVDATQENLPIYTLN